MASANDHNIESPNEVTAVAVTQIIDADTQKSTQSSVQNSTQKNEIQNRRSTTDTDMGQAEQKTGLTTLIDPITHKSIDNSIH
ncbi:hypothetical protein [Psychrobacter sp. WY6]|uniref:hypothetical protein n=1 Tax=Psychrobacter sp. WY6 TaxID=2708350 RepID=UPI0020230D83|nr:hypothetical protein [Psychrobacter sp. WY6]